MWRLCTLCAVQQNIISPFLHSYFFFLVPLLSLVSLDHIFLSIQFLIISLGCLALSFYCFQYSGVQNSSPLQYTVYTPFHWHLFPAFICSYISCYSSSVSYYIMTDLLLFYIWLQLIELPLLMLHYVYHTICKHPSSSSLNWRTCSLLNLSNP